MKQGHHDSLIFKMGVFIRLAVIYMLFQGNLSQSNTCSSKIFTLTSCTPTTEYFTNNFTGMILFVESSGWNSSAVLEENTQNIECRNVVLIQDNPSHMHGMVGVAIEFNYVITITNQFSRAQNHWFSKAFTEKLRP